MDDYQGHERRALDPEALHKSDLELFSARLDNRLDRILNALENMAKWQEDRDQRIDRNAADIKEIRDWKHDIVQTIQTNELNIGPFTPVTSSFLVANLDTIKQGIAVLKMIDTAHPIDKNESDLLRQLLQETSVEDWKYVATQHKEHEDGEAVKREISIGREVERYGIYAVIAIWTVGELASHFHWF